MNRIVVDESMGEQLRAANEPCIIFDAAGNALGYFSRTYVGHECPFSEEELQQAAQEGGGRPLREILAEFESQK